MKLYFMKDDALAYFKQNVEYNFENYLKKDNNWIFDKFSNNSPLFEFKFEVSDFKMDMSSNNAGDTDYNNVKVLYTALKLMSDTQASDERFWAGLSHGVLWNYMQYRCQLSNQNVSPNKIIPKLQEHYCWWLRKLNNG